MNYRAVGAAAVSKDEAKAQGARKATVPARDQDAGRYFRADHSGDRGVRLPDGHYGVAQVHGEQRLHRADSTSSLFVFADLFSNVAYTFLPILIAFSAAKVFGGNPFLGAVVGMIMIHPSLAKRMTVADGVQTYQEVFFGLYEVPLVGYQGMSFRSSSRW